MRDSLDHRLQERVKELTALHRTARLLQDVQSPVSHVLTQVAALLPPAWQYPEITEGCISLGGESWSTPGFRTTVWSQKESFQLRDGTPGSLEVVYTEERPEADEGPFLQEERELIRSLTDMIRAYCQHRQDDDSVARANERLEKVVSARTESLRRLASEVCLVEERERRAIAEELHDHLGQGLAFIRARLHQLRGDGIFEGRSKSLDELLEMVDQAIRFTRSLTFELSPPVLYELGLGAALDWLGEEYSRKHGFSVTVQERGHAALPDDLRVLLFKSARELLHNIAKHSKAAQVDIRLICSGDEVELIVRDDGIGFAVNDYANWSGFGLFSIQERLRNLGGGLEITSSPGSGARIRLTAPLKRPELPRHGSAGKP